MNNPKIIFIDWNKTLSDSKFWEHMSNPKHEHSAFHSEITNCLFSENKHLINPWMRGEYSSKSISKMISKHVGLDADIVHSELAESCKNMEFVSDEIPDLIQKIRSKGIKAVIATDNMDTFRKFTIEGMGLDELFDDFLISHEIGYLKGDFGEGGKLLFFEKLMKENGISFEEAILLDDSVDESKTLDKAGLKTVQITDAEILVEVLNNYAF